MINNNIYTADRVKDGLFKIRNGGLKRGCLLYTSDAADE